MNRRVARGRVIGLWAASLLTVTVDGPGRRILRLTDEGRKTLRLWDRARRQHVVEASAWDVKRSALPTNSGRHPLLSAGQYFAGEARPGGAHQDLGTEVHEAVPV
ncbi:hypothetical protein [Streptomyces sp. NPDC051572]|uniref:hypothetical protein n=1 Tax=Streptomyces sp. NPDC051572 TaxID=3155802 RepID=UPI003450E130